MQVPLEDVESPPMNATGGKRDFIDEVCKAPCSSHTRWSCIDGRCACFPGTSKVYKRRCGHLGTSICNDLCYAGGWQKYTCDDVGDCVCSRQNAFWISTTCR